MATETTNTPPDWERIEADYRAGVLSLRELAAQHPGTNHVAISRRAKREGWSRDLNARIQARADELVTREAVTAPVTADRTVSDRSVVEANAERIAQVRSEHRKDIGKARSVVAKLLADLSGVADRPDLGDQLVQAMADAENWSSDEDGGALRRKLLRESLERITSIPGKASVLKSLSESLKNLVPLERQAYGIDAGPQKDAPGEINISF